MKHGQIYVGIGGWTFAPWRGTFYPEDLPQKRELAFASNVLTSIEVNGTYYSTFKPATFAKWREETPQGFVFSLKASRYCTNRKQLASAGEAVERFIGQGIHELGDRLGPINWQFMATKHFNAEDIEGFLKLLSQEVHGLPLRHALEVRHASFQTPEFYDLAHRYKVAVVLADSDEFPKLEEPTGDFTYARLMRSQEDVPSGYTPASLSHWARARRHGQNAATPSFISSQAPKSAIRQQRKR